MKIAEEAAEIAQAALKAAQFGHDSFSPLDPDKTTNLESLAGELGDLQGTVDMLEHTEHQWHGLCIDGTYHERQFAKEKKLVKFARIQHRLNRLSYHHVFDMERYKDDN